MERKEAILELFQGTAELQKQIEEQLKMIPKLNEEGDKLLSLLKAKLTETNTKKDILTEDNGLEEDKELMNAKSPDDRWMIEARRKITDPVISYETSKINFVEPPTWTNTWNPRDPSWWYFSKPIPGEPVNFNTFYPPYAFHPKSLGIQIWNALYNLFAIYVVLVLPYDIGAELDIKWVIIASVFSTLCTVIDLYFQLRTAIEDENGIHTDFKHILKRRIHSGKAIADVLIGLPWVLVEIIIPKWKYITGFHALSIFKLLDDRDIFFLCSFTKLARKYQIKGVFVDALKILLWQFLYWHWATCGNILLGIKSLETTPIAIYTDNLEKVSSIQLDYQNLTIIQSYLSVLNSIAGLAFQVLYLTVLETYLMHFDMPGRLFSEKLEELNQFSDYKGFGSIFRQQLLDYHGFKYSDNEKKIAKQLNDPLRVYISIRGCQDLITRVPFFRDCDSFFISQVVMVLELEYFIKNDLIIEEGTLGDKMYFIATGRVEVILNGASRAKLGPGHFFGEIALLLGHTRRTASIRSMENCILYSLSRKNLDVVLEGNLAMTRRMKQVAQERLNNDRSRKQTPLETPPTPSKSVVNSSASMLSAHDSENVRKEDSQNSDASSGNLKKEDSYASSISRLDSNAPSLESKSKTSTTSKPVSSSLLSPASPISMSLQIPVTTDRLGRRQSFIQYKSGETPDSSAIAIEEGFTIEIEKEPSIHHPFDDEADNSLPPPSPNTIARHDLASFTASPMISIDGNLNQKVVTIDRNGRRQSVLQYQPPQTLLDPNISILIKEEHSLVMYGDTEEMQSQMDFEHQEIVVGEQEIILFEEKAPQRPAKKAITLDRHGRRQSLIKYDAKPIKFVTQNNQLSEEEYSNETSLENDDREENEENDCFTGERDERLVIEPINSIEGRKHNVISVDRHGRRQSVITYDTNPVLFVPIISMSHSEIIEENSDLKVSDEQIIPPFKLSVEAVSDALHLNTKIDSRSITSLNSYNASGYLSPPLHGKGANSDKIILQRSQESVRSDTSPRGGRSALRNESPEKISNDNIIRDSVHSIASESKVKFSESHDKLNFITEDLDQNLEVCSSFVALNNNVSLNRPQSSKSVNSNNSAVDIEDSVVENLVLQ